MSTDTKRPKKYRRPPVSEYRCQFCTAASPVEEWKAKDDACPKCGRKYDAILAQEGDD